MVRRPALTIAVLTTGAAVAQRILLASGVDDRLSGRHPWPFLLLAVPAWLVARPWAGRRVPAVLVRWADALRRIPAPAGALAVLGAAAAVWAVLQDHEPLIGHEEAVYANKARSWRDGTPAAGWGDYRPPGLAALGRLALAVHDDVGALRAVALLLTLFTLTVTWCAAARWTGPRQAVVVTLLVLGGLGFLRRVPEFLNDIGATGLLLLVVLLLVRAQEKPGPLTLPAAAVAALAAFHLRYGVVGNLLAVVLAALLAYGPRAWLAQGRRLAVAGGILLAGLVPHCVLATRTRGWPLGLILDATGRANRSYPGDGLVYYLAVFPYRLAGDLGAVVMTAGLCCTAAAVRRVLRGRTGRPDDRRHAFLGLTAVLVPVVLGLATDGEPRFVYLPVVLLTVLGVRYTAERAGRGAGPLLAAVAALAAVTVAATAQYVAHAAMPGPMAQHASTVPVARGLAGPGPCLVVTAYEPETGWYSGCDAVTFDQYRTGPRPPAAVRTHLVLYARGRLQPGPAVLRRLIGDREATVRVVGTRGSLGGARVITLR
ncbi:glycosyltransferase family 39 protein [Streptomyces sp. I05A-00742]|uniref:glycosyltransferase family 39 protein n=1 Tax=Streptomyces sp. I05A-00742 TaxID=2732853 RepID=UPI00289F6564|nr:glycosyltransferase family 39 protein [Streptomyces sp. I05A-00742]